MAHKPHSQQLGLRVSATGVVMADHARRGADKITCRDFAEIHNVKYFAYGT
jgi:hypothetical protein